MKKFVHPKERECNQGPSISSEIPSRKIVATIVVLAIVIIYAVCATAYVNANLV